MLLELEEMYELGMCVCMCLHQYLIGHLLLAVLLLKSRGLVELWYSFSPSGALPILWGWLFWRKVELSTFVHVSDVRAELTRIQMFLVMTREIGKATIYCMAVFHGGAFNRTHFITF
jgi:hypothetical protein